MADYYSEEANGVFPRYTALDSEAVHTDYSPAVSQDMDLAFHTTDRTCQQSVGCHGDIHAPGFELETSRDMFI